MHPDFDPQPTLCDGGLTLRPLTPDDRSALHQAADDPVLWAGHPAKDRHKRAQFDPYFNVLLTSKATLVAIVQDEIIGCSRYYAAPDQAQSVSIGYTFLRRDHWGGRTNFRMKDLMLTYAFSVVDPVWLHIDPNNIRSQHATARLGAVHVSTSKLDLGNGPAEWQSWQITSAAWQAQRRPT